MSNGRFFLKVPTEFLIKKESREIRKISKQNNEVFIQALEF